MTATAVLDSAEPRRRGRPNAFDREYWLTHSDGYLVEGSGGRVGVVHEVRLRDGRPAHIAVRAGLLGRRLLVFPAADVAFVVPRAKRIYLQSAAAPLAAEPVSVPTIEAP